MPSVYTATGSRLFVAPSVATPPPDALTYAGLAWTEVSLVESIGAYGDESAVITAAMIGDGRIRKSKGARDAGNSEIVCFPQQDDAGQSALVAAEGTYSQYPIKVELPHKLWDGSNAIDYFTALVTSERKEVGANDNILRRRFNLAITSDVTHYGGPFTPAVAGVLSLHLSDVDRFQDAAGTVDATANNDPVGHWVDQSGQDRHVVQATAGNRPLLQTAYPSVKFDGTNDYLAFAGAFPDTEGSAAILFKTGATDFLTRGLQVIVSRADTGAANEWFEIGLTAQGRLYMERNVGGTKHTVVGSSFLNNSTVYSVIVTFGGLDYYAMANSTEQNPLIFENVGTPGWFGDVSSGDNIVVGGTLTSGGLARPFQGEILELILYAEAIT